MQLARGLRHDPRPTCESDEIHPGRRHAATAGHEFGHSGVQAVASNDGVGDADAHTHGELERDLRSEVRWQVTVSQGPLQDMAQMDNLWPASWRQVAAAAWAHSPAPTSRRAGPSGAA